MSHRKARAQLKQVKRWWREELISEEQYKTERHQCLAQMHFIGRQGVSRPESLLRQQTRGLDFWATGGMVPSSRRKKSSSQKSDQPLLMNRYRLERLLGEGGMGQVYLAWDCLMQQQYALKLIHPSLLQHSVSLQRFIQEFALTQQLFHPGITRSFALHQDDVTGAIFFTMEVLEGETLEMFLSRYEKVPDLPLVEPEVVVRWVFQLAEILGYAHREGVIHRDLKPGNVMVLPDQSLKLMDFGIARILAGTTTTQHTGTVGSVFYMAPEQVKGLEVTHACDVYSLGVLTYQMLTGEIPLGRVIPPSRLVEGLNPVIDDLLLQTMDPRPEHRPVGTMEFANSLQRAFSGSALGLHHGAEQRLSAGTTKKLQSSVRTAEVFCPAGVFGMGSALDDEEAYGDEKPRTQVSLQHSFWMLETPVTQQFWSELMGNNPSYFQGDGRRPVEWISWYDAIAFCNALSRAEGLEEAYILRRSMGTPGTSFVCDVEWKGFDCQGYRLPTEAEWEYACRADSTHVSHGLLEQRAWFADNAEGETHLVGEKQPNPWGLQDMLGNVLEWCWDSWVPSLPGGICSDLVRTSEDNNRKVARGGSWISVERNCRPTDRNWYVAGFRNNYLGFRVCRTA